MNEEMSNDLYERAVKHMPGGVNSPVRAYKAVDRVPRFIASAKGDRITDVDGNEMIDYICSWGPGILGHAHDRVIAKVKELRKQALHMVRQPREKLRWQSLYTSLFLQWR